MSYPPPSLRLTSPFWKLFHAFGAFLYLQISVFHQFHTFSLWSWPGVPSCLHSFTNREAMPRTSWRPNLKMLPQLLILLDSSAAIELTAELLLIYMVFILCIFYLFMITQQIHSCVLILPCCYELFINSIFNGFILFFFCNSLNFSLMLDIGVGSILVIRSNENN